MCVSAYTEGKLSDIAKQKGRGEVEPSAYLQPPYPASHPTNNHPGTYLVLQGSTLKFFSFVAVVEAASAVLSVCTSGVRKGGGGAWSCEHEATPCTTVLRSITLHMASKKIKPSENCGTRHVIMPLSGH